MKSNQLYRIVFILFSCVLLCACSGAGDLDDLLNKQTANTTNSDNSNNNNQNAAANNEISASETSLSFTADGGSKNISVTSNFSWETISKPSWITLSPSSGSNGITNITVTASSSTSASSRTSTISLGNSSKSVSISVSQGAASISDGISASVSSLSFVADGESKNIIITSNFSWETTNMPSWITITPSSGSSGSTSITVTTSRSTSTSTRSGTLSFGKSSVATVSIPVSQYASSFAGSDETFKVNGVSFKMVYIEGGTFTMGATSEQHSEAEDIEFPTHSVTLSSYYMGETEVTRELWYAVMGSYPPYSSYSGSKIPIESVSWYDCQEFLTRLNSLTGETFRLPTEAQWEFSARGGNKSKGYKYAGSNTIGDVAWYEDNWYTGSGNFYGPHEVKTKRANELGLYDMSGNVGEWCQDLYGEYSKNSQTDPFSLKGYRGIWRGGWYGTSALACRVSWRAKDHYNDPFANIGFRLALY